MVIECPPVDLGEGGCLLRQPFLFDGLAFYGWLYDDE
jgi:hypothetical protein